MEKRHLEYGQSKRAFLAYLQRDPQAMKLAERVRDRIGRKAMAKGVKFTPAYNRESEVYARGVVDHVCEQLEKKGYIVDAGNRQLLASQLLYSNLLDGDGGGNLFGSSPSHHTQRSGRSSKPSEHQIARVRRRERD